MLRISTVFEIQQIHLMHPKPGHPKKKLEGWWLDVNLASFQKDLFPAILVRGRVLRLLAELRVVQRSPACQNIWVTF